MRDYQNGLLEFLKLIQKDLQDNKINKQQFDFLLGFFITKQINSFINQEIIDITPTDNQKIKQMNFLSYRKDSNHASYVR